MGEGGGDLVEDSSVCSADKEIWVIAGQLGRDGKGLPQISPAEEEDNLLEEALEDKFMDVSALVRIWI